MAVRSLALLLPLVAVLAAGCTAKRPVTEWYKPDASEDERRAVAAECHSIARNQVERDYRLNELTERERDVAGESGLRQRLDRYDAQRSIQRMFESCMRENGYRPIDRED